jgi:manganese efflux pump family protein
MAVWIITVIIGGYLLAAGIGNEHRQAAEARAGTTAAPAGTSEAATAHPLLEFCHPALGVIGLMFWIFFVVSDHPVFAWTAFGMLAATALAGLTWLIGGAAVRRRARVPRAPVFPRHLVRLHGIAVICTFTLVLIAATGHG